MEEMDVKAEEEQNEMLLELQKMNHKLAKQLFYQRIVTLSMLALAAIAVLICISVKDEVAGYGESLQVIAQNMEKMDMESLTKSMTTLEKKVNELDIDSLNESIHLLEEKIGELDVDALNEALESMKQVSDSLDDASNSMKSVNEWFKNVFNIQ